MIFVLDKNHHQTKPIRIAKSASYKEQLNGEYILDFEAVLESYEVIDKSSMFMIANSNAYFDMLRFNKNALENGTYSVNVYAEHVSYRLNNENYNLESFDLIGTPTTLITEILNGTEFSVGIVEITGMFHMISENETSRRRLLMEYATFVNGELEFEGFVIHVRRRRGNPISRPIVRGRHVSIINHSLDNSIFDEHTGRPEERFTCRSLYLPSDEYSLGDNVRLMNETLGINLDYRIVSLSRNPYNDKDVQFEIYSGPTIWHGQGLDRLFGNIQHNIIETDRDHFPSVQSIRAQPFVWQDMIETSWFDRVVTPANTGPGYPGHDHPRFVRKFIRLRHNELRWMRAELVEQRRPYLTEPDWWDTMPPQPPDWDGTWLNEWGIANKPDDWVDGVSPWPSRWPQGFVRESESTLMTHWFHPGEMMGERGRGKGVFWMYMPDVPIFVGVVRIAINPSSDSVRLYEISSSTEFSGTVQIGTDTVSYTGIDGNLLIGVSGISREWPRGTLVYRTVLSSDWDGVTTPMTLDDPVLFNPPVRDPNATPDQNARQDEAHKLAHRVMLWNMAEHTVEEEEDPPFIGTGEGIVEIWRRFPTASNSSNGADNGDDPDPPVELPEGVYSVSRLRRIELIREEDWKNKVEAGEIDPDVDYRIPYAGDFEQRVLSTSEAVLGAAMQEVGVALSTVLRE